jgi:hypothetical protein
LIRAAASTQPLWFRPFVLFLVDIPRKQIYICGMNYNEDKVDDMVLALLHLTSSRDNHGVVRAWKGHDWDAMDRLHEKGFISDPKSKSKSVVLSDDGARKAQELFQRLCGS